jgi:hypothetical protein
MTLTITASTVDAFGASKLAQTDSLQLLNAACTLTAYLAPFCMIAEPRYGSRSHGQSGGTEVLDRRC